MAGHKQADSSGLVKERGRSSAGDESGGKVEVPAAGCPGLVDSPGGERKERGAKETCLSRQRGNSEKWGRIE